MQRTCYKRPQKKDIIYSRDVLSCVYFSLLTFNDCFLKALDPIIFISAIPEKHNHLNGRETEIVNKF